MNSIEPNPSASADHQIAWSLRSPSARALMLLCANAARLSVDRRPARLPGGRGRVPGEDLRRIRGAPFLAEPQDGAAHEARPVRPGGGSGDPDHGRDAPPLAAD